MAIDATLTVSNAALGVTHSFSGRRWVLSEVGEDAERALTRAADISPVLARLLAERGVEPGDAADYLNPTLKRFLPEPLQFLDMEKAVARTAAALARQEKIAVFGDYDVDGSCSTALLSDFLTALGHAPRIYIPDRLTEGYGPSAHAMRQLQAEGTVLVITVDCGAAAYDALSAARDAGLDVIVLDHHAIEKAPPAFAQVNPNQPGDNSGHGHLCAAGVTFLFAVALNRHLREQGWYAASGVTEPDLRDALDLVGLATICDVVPLKGANRAFVRAALPRLSALSRPGIRALAAVAKAEPPYTPYHCGFVFGPRINAGGRVGRCSLGVEALTARNDTDAAPLAKLLDRHNRERRAIEGVILEEAIGLAARQDNAPFLLVSGKDWHSGVVGIVAGRLKDRFAKPAFVVGFDDGRGRGSARSIAGVDIGAMVRAAHEQGLLEAGGGHAMAAGFTVLAAQLDPFQDFLGRWFARAPAATDAAGTLQCAALISASGATLALVEDIAKAGPFGAGNAEPLLVVPNARVVFADVVGEAHVRLRLEGAAGGRLEAIAFRAATTALGEGLLRARGRMIHAAGFLRADSWNGTRRVQFQVQDAALPA
jgi:single-stranded-DNA-specific exonuclease